jgi:hypothetical protein
VAAVTAIVAGISTNHLSAPPTLLLMAILLSIGVIDAFAGFVAATILFIGTVVTGNANDLGTLLTAFAIGTLAYAPGLIASSIRPLRRLITSADSVWERITDYLVTGALTGYTISLILSGINALNSQSFDIATNPTPLVLISIVAVFVRLALEDIALYLFPSRLRANAVHYAPPRTGQKFISLLFTSTLFVFVAERFVGFSITLALGTAIVFLPVLIKIMLGGRIRVSKAVGRWIPLGPLQLLLLVILNGLIAIILTQYIPDSHRYVVWSFILFAIPTFIIGLISLFANPEFAEEWRTTSVGRFIYRLGGVAVFIGLIFLVKGTNIATSIYNLFT